MLMLVICLIPSSIASDVYKRQVLCIRANNKVDAEFLYYLLSQDLFFAYVMSGANGSKMPRGAVYLDSNDNEPKKAEVLKIISNL